MSANLSQDFSRYDQKLEFILRESARIFAEKSYHSTSMRDIARATGVSLAGLYHYCKSKDELLFLIQGHCFGRVLERVEERLREVSDPVDKLRIVIENTWHSCRQHGRNESVVTRSLFAHGDLQNPFEQKRQYTELVRQVLAEVRGSAVTSEQNAPPDLTVATYALFGMMNWIYNWYDPRGSVSKELVDSYKAVFYMLSVGRQRPRFSSSKPAENLSVWRAPNQSGTLPGEKKMMRPESAIPGLFFVSRS